MAAKEGVVANFIWKFAERVSAQLISFVVSIILARILEPSHYGVVTMVTVFMTLANTLVSEGFGSALIQKKDAKAVDYSTVLYFNLAFSLVLYLLLYFSAPLIADFFGEGYQELVPVLRILGVTIFTSGISSVQQAYVSKKMIFRKFFAATIVGTILSGVVGIYMAYAGFGVWALVVQNIVGSITGVVVLAISLKKRPVRAFSFLSLKSMVGYGSRVLATGMIISVYQEIRTVLIGKVYTSSDLAYYNKGRSFPNLIVVNINASLSAVLFPKIANVQDNIEEVRTTLKRSLRLGSYIMFPLMVGMLCVSDNFVRLVLTEKWLPCVPMLQVFCLIYLFQPMHTANVQAIKGIGRSDICLRLEIIKKILELLSLILVVRISVNAIAVSMAVLTTLFTAINAYPNKKLFGYGFKDQVRDLLGALGMSVLMGVCVIAVGWLPLPLWICLGLQIVAGVTIYIGLSELLKNKEYLYIKSLLKRLLCK